MVRARRVAHGCDARADEVLRHARVNRLLHLGLRPGPRGLRALQPKYDLYERGNRVNRFPWLADLLIWRAKKSPRLLQRMSGIASATAAYVAAVEGYPVRIIDTRKTAPGLRLLDKYAVRAGGGSNHRYNLADALLIKDNHLAVAREAGMDMAAMLAHVRRRVSPFLKIEVEVESLL